MARRRRRRLSDTVKVKVSLPSDIDVPATLPYAPVRQQQSRTRAKRIPLVDSTAKFVRRTVYVRKPTTSYVLNPSVSMVRPGQLTIFGKRHAQKLLGQEDNRRRYKERKARRRRLHHGQLESVRRDSFGLLGRAARQGRSARYLADAALVTRSLDVYFRRRK